MVKVPAPIEELIKQEGLEGLIGETHRLTLESLMSGKKTPSEVFEEIKGKYYISTEHQVIRALDQLAKIHCVKEVGRKRTEVFTSPIESVYKITDLGKKLLQSLARK